MPCGTIIERPSWQEHLGGKRPRSFSLSASSAVRVVAALADTGKRPEQTLRGGARRVGGARGMAVGSGR